MGCEELEHIPEVSFLPTADPRRVRERGKAELEIKPKGLLLTQFPMLLIPE